MFLGVQSRHNAHPCGQSKRSPQLVVGSLQFTPLRIIQAQSGAADTRLTVQAAVPVWLFETQAHLCVTEIGQGGVANGKQELSTEIVAPATPDSAKVNSAAPHAIRNGPRKVRMKISCGRRRRRESNDEP